MKIPLFLNHKHPTVHEHKSHRAPWLRAAVLGADDGIVSVASIMLGVAAAGSPKHVILTAGFAGLIAGAMSMAAGEYVSVSSQLDSEQADLEIEKRELEMHEAAELKELEEIYVRRGLDRKLAKQVATQLHDHDALVAHARDELGIEHDDMARPSQAALYSALSFALGAILPVGAGLLFSGRAATLAIVASVVVALSVLGAVGAWVGGGNPWKASLRVLVGGGLAMAVTSLIGHFVGLSVN